MMLSRLGKWVSGSTRARRQLTCDTLREIGTSTDVHIGTAMYKNPSAKGLYPIDKSMLSVVTADSDKLVKEGLARKVGTNTYEVIE